MNVSIFFIILHFARVVLALPEQLMREYVGLMYEIDAKEHCKQPLFIASVMHFCVFRLINMLH